MKVKKINKVEKQQHQNE